GPRAGTSSWLLRSGLGARGNGTPPATGGPGRSHRNADTGGAAVAGHGDAGRADAELPPQELDADRDARGGADHQARAGDPGPERRPSTEKPDDHAEISSPAGPRQATDSDDARARHL